MKVIDVCSTLQELCALDRIMEKLPAGLEKRTCRKDCTDHK